MMSVQRREQLQSPTFQAAGWGTPYEHGLLQHLWCQASWSTGGQAAACQQLSRSLCILQPSLRQLTEVHRSSRVVPCIACGPSAARQQRSGVQGARRGRPAAHGGRAVRAAAVLPHAGVPRHPADCGWAPASLPTQSGWAPSVGCAWQACMELKDPSLDIHLVDARPACAGKSAIHGWGAFAKTPHAAGDMVIEYQGEVVRASVADTRERRLYDTLVGAGTYVFTLNTDHQLAVDATRQGALLRRAAACMRTAPSRLLPDQRQQCIAWAAAAAHLRLAAWRLRRGSPLPPAAGNMAHLLNHSCAPNCVSRNHTIADPASGESLDHVIIFALREIAPAEELTYDYRCACTAAGANQSWCLQCAAGELSDTLDARPVCSTCWTPSR